jgi:hypothetical protein
VTSRRVGLAWDSPTVFTRFIEDCGVQCELVTPQLLAAPFFRGHYSTLVVPTGFANRKYSSLLPALKAASPRIRSFLEKGGRMLVYGAGDAREDAYSWLPFPVSYHMEYRTCRIGILEDGEHVSILEGYNPEKVDCDGWFSDHGGDPLMTCGDRTVCIREKVGEGVVYVTTIHEYPARCFISSFCEAGHETLF